MAETDQTAKAKAAQKAEKKATQAKAQEAKAKGADKGEKKPRQKSDYVARLKTVYESEIRPKLTKDRGYTNPFQVPKITKIVLNMGIGEGVADRKKVDNAAADLTMIAGQKAVITKSRKSIATYKLRDGQAIGCKVTLRKARMYEFLDRLVTVAMPRVRDFRGLPANKGFDGRGNFAMGMKEQIVFPEINYDRVDTVRGMDIQFVTTARTDKEAKALLKAFALPFQN